jgi:hypothetical protein
MPRFSRPPPPRTRLQQVSRSSAPVKRRKGDTFWEPLALRQSGWPDKYSRRTRCETTRAPGFPRLDLITKPPGACDCIQPAPAIHCIESPLLPSTLELIATPRFFLSQFQIHRQRHRHRHPHLRLELCCTCQTDALIDPKPILLCTVANRLLHLGPATAPAEKNKNRRQHTSQPVWFPLCSLSTHQPDSKKREKGSHALRVNNTIVIPRLFFVFISFHFIIPFHNGFAT